jgi:hypothetical protein
LWEFFDKKNEARILVIDSIEMLGRDLNESSTILKIYYEFITEMMNYYDFIIIGTDGNTCPKGIEVFGEIQNNFKKSIGIDFKKAIKELKIEYTDADHSFIAIDQYNFYKIYDNLKNI